MSGRAKASGAAFAPTAAATPVGDGGSWRLLFEKLSEGFVVGELIRDDAGRVVDWLYLDVNPAGGALVGCTVEEVIGRTARDVIPDFEEAWVDHVAEVVATRRPHSFTRAIGGPGRCYEGHAFHLEADRFAIVFVEVTERQRAGQRQAALLSLGDHIRDLADAGEISALGARLVGEALGATRVAFGRIDAASGTIELEAGWTTPGTHDLAGVHRFSDFGRLLEEMMRGEPLVIGDVRTDPRTADDPGRLLTLGVGALVNMPVRERGRTVAALIVHFREPRRWLEDEVAFLRNVADRVEVGVARLQAEKHQAMLNGEMAHRMKNTLAMVQAIATQTLRRQADPVAFGDFERRLGALGSAHDVLLGRGWSSADLRAAAEGVLGVIVATERVRLSGPPTMLGARAAVSLSLLLHELATNAAKYGALSTEDGVVSLRWSVDAAGLLTLCWEERGGPPATEPSRNGFGTRLIKAGLTGTGGVALHYEEVGFSAIMRASMAELQSA